MNTNKHEGKNEGAPRKMMERKAQAEFSLVRARGLEFEVMVLAAIEWPDGSEMVPAGTVGQVPRGMRYGGERPGFWVDWGDYGKCTLPASAEGVGWVRVNGGVSAVMVS